MKIAKIATIATIALAATAFAGPQVGGYAGLNIASASGDDADAVDGSKMGVAVGVVADIPFSEMIALRTGALYDMKGASGDMMGQDITMSYSYLTIPLVAKASFPAGGVTAYAGAGVDVGINLSAEAEVGDESNDIKDVSTLDFALDLMVGAEMPMGNGAAFAQAGYVMGLTTVDASDAEADVKLNAIKIGAGYKINL